MRNRFAGNRKYWEPRKVMTSIILVFVWLTQGFMRVKTFSSNIKSLSANTMSATTNNPHRHNPNKTIISKTDNDSFLKNVKK